MGGSGGCRRKGGTCELRLWKKVEAKLRIYANGGCGVSGPDGEALFCSFASFVLFRSGLAIARCLCLSAIHFKRREVGY